jgi:hypothetical protein
VKLNLGGSVHDPTDPVGRLLFNLLAMVAEFEADLARMRTREGMKVAKAKGRLRGKQPKLSTKQEAHLVALHQAGEHTIGELEELFSITRSTVYRTIARDRVRVAPLTPRSGGSDASAGPRAPGGMLGNSFRRSLRPSLPQRLGPMAGSA